MSRFTGTVEERIRRIVLEEFEYEHENQITSQTNFSELADERYKIWNVRKKYPEEPYDGLEVITIITETEHEFGITISDKEGKMIETLQNLVDLVEKRKTQALNDPKKLF